MSVSPSSNGPRDDEPRRTLLRQHDTAWSLLTHHLRDLSTAECLWRPAASGLHVHRHGDAAWVADWPEHESYDLGPPSIAWLTWHIGFWWSMALSHSFGDATLTRDAVLWPGDADAARDWLADLRRRWRAAIEALESADLASDGLARWPFRGRPFSDVVAWANLELMKNASEIGYVRFLYAARAPAGDSSADLARGDARR